jgi:hypothetical protein
MLTNEAKTEQFDRLEILIMLNDSHVVELALYFQVRVYVLILCTG